MTDVELLREYASFSGTPIEMRAVLLSSAIRIEKLEVALREIDEWAEEQCYVGLRKLIRKALEGKDDVD
jgi:hypothetical protein